jgi:hypothetical protein
MKVTKYFISLTETTGDVQTSEWINTKGDVLQSPRLTYDVLMCFPYSQASHTSFPLSTFFISSRNILLIVSKDRSPSQQCWSITFASWSLAVTVRVVHNASSVSCLSKYQSPLCLTPTPSLLPVVLSSIIQLYQSAITRQSISSTKALRDTKLTGNDGAYKTEDNVIDGVHFRRRLLWQADKFHRLFGWSLYTWVDVEYMMQTHSTYLWHVLMLPNLVSNLNKKFHLT